MHLLKLNGPLAFWKKANTCNDIQWNLDNSKSKGPNSFVWIIETLNNWRLKCIYISVGTSKWFWIIENFELLEFELPKFYCIIHRLFSLLPCKSDLGDGGVGVGVKRWGCGGGGAGRKGIKTERKLAVTDNVEVVNNCWDFCGFMIVSKII